MGIADSMKEITADIMTSYDTRVKALGDLVVDTRKSLKGCASDRKKMAREQAETLKKGETDRLKSFKVMMGGIQKDIKDIETYVINKLKEFSDAHADMSEEQAETLKKGETDRLKSFKVMMGGIQKDIKDIETYVKKLLGEYSADMKKAANAWQGMSKTMARARKGRAMVPKVETGVGVRHIKEAIEEEEEEVPPEAELEKKVLKFIKKHPEGVKVSDMEEPLGVARTSLGVIAKRLLEAGRVRKEENLYFPL